jgi:hypothetical protein
MEMEFTRVFSPRLERAYLAIMTVFLVILFYQHAGVGSAWNFRAPFAQFFMSIICLNFIHLLFSLILLIGYPEFRNWFLDFCKSQKFVRFVVISILILWAGVLTVTRISDTEVIFVSILILCLRSIHNVGQVKGLSLMYNGLHAPKLTPSELEKQKQLEKIERFLFAVMIFLIFADHFFADVVKTKIDLRWVFASLSVLCGFGIFANALRYPKIKESNKPWFLTTLIFVALSGWSQAAFILQNSLHGLEYSFLCADMTKRSAVKINIARMFFVASVVAMFAILGIFLLGFVDVGSYRTSMPWRTLVVVGFFIEFFHYYIDSLMFRFRDPAVREHLQAVVMPI